ncbi:MAG: hypothetical protein UY72_C0004G0012 [Candidatus Uhrbacteria bacterium GW2011_GWD2_52_7]|uniref:CxxC-x17-CxxC domain-containing protein n=1 Tax=Candidatus Uhrbacteria bacterium GW2011_GWD2_52_7 TaxID=1618989 RepID=A0A0G1XHL2_9BACT|nr:MAG: hypothetical protein UY72_C0004G0012 [Candidatus Uhrbacteria bacterium GW2011_GWD2_52_7]
MKVFNRNQGSGGFKGGKKFVTKGPWKPKFEDRGGDYVKPELFPATCNDCGKECEVPFKPNGRKPVLCRDCFKKDDAGAPRFDDRKPAFKKFDRPAYGDKRPSYQAPISKNYDEQFEVINEKLDEIIAMLAAE